jgi:DNA-binding Xre family transcriptional regulator
VADRWTTPAPALPSHLPTAPLMAAVDRYKLRRGVSDGDVAAAFGFTGNYLSKLRNQPSLKLDLADRICCGLGLRLEDVYGPGWAEEWEEAS